MAEDITRILVPIDFSPHADRAYRYATRLAQRLGAGVELLHVVEDPFVTGAWSPEIYVPQVPELLADLIAGAQRQLIARKESTAPPGLTVEIAVITGRPAHAIAEHARDGRFDLIVMGTHGRTGLSHVVLGSVAERVLRKASCPVLIVQAAGAGAAEARPAAA